MTSSASRADNTSIEGRRRGDTSNKQHATKSVQMTNNKINARGREGGLESMNGAVD